MTELDIASPGLLVDSEGFILDINEAALRTFGYHRTEIVGRHINTLIPENKRLQHSHGFSLFMAGKKTKISCIRVTGLTKYNEPLYLTVSASKTRGGIITIISNSTIKEKYEQKILQKLR